MTRIMHRAGIGIIHGVGVTHGAGDGLSEFPSDLVNAGTADSTGGFSVQASGASALVTLASSIRGSDASDLPMRVLVAVSAAAVADSMIKSVASRGPPSIVGLPAKLRWGLRAMMRCRLRDRLARARRRLRESCGPRHHIHHPRLDVVYFSNEQGCSVTAYRLDRANGTLSSVQTTSTVPAGHSERTTCSQIHLTPSGRYLYVGNRAANGSSIAAFAVDPATGQLNVAGHTPTEAVPSAFCLDPVGHFLFTAGTASGRLASYRINQQTGALTPLAVAEVGQRPAAVLATRLH